MSDLPDTHQGEGEGAGAQQSPSVAKNAEAAKEAGASNNADTGADTAADTSADAADTSNNADTSSSADASTNGKRRKLGKGKIALITVAAVLVLLVAGGGTVYATQHNNPDFCNFVCHSPMDPYVASYKDGTSINSVQAANGVLLSVTVHKKAGEESGSAITCLSCHDSDLGEQINEGMHWVTGNYTDPLEPLVLVSGEPQEGQKDGAAFCLRSGCHAGITNAEELKQATATGLRNPHNTPHGKYINCSGCHQTHEQSTNACAYCHPDAPLPEGWVKPEKSPNF